MAKRVVEKKVHAKKKIKPVIETGPAMRTAKSIISKDRLLSPSDDHGNYVLVAKRNGKIVVMWGGFAKREDARELRELAITLRSNKNLGPLNLDGCDFIIAQGEDHVAGSTVNYQPELSKRHLPAPINPTDSMQVESTIDLGKE